jgi:hypothetical protein
MVTLPAHGSVVIVTADEPPAKLSVFEQDEVRLDLTTPWRIATPPRNILRLGRFRVRICRDDGDDEAAAVEVPPEPFINVLSRLSERGQIPVHISPGGMTPTAWRADYPQTVTWRASFDAEHIPDDLRLVVDRSGIRGGQLDGETARVLLNGHRLALSEAEDDFIFDHSQCSWPIAEVVAPGRNTIAVTIRVEADDHGLTDAMWVTGDFRVEGEPSGVRTIVEPSPTALPLDLPASGLPHFAGTLELEREIALSGGETHLALEPPRDAFLDCAELSVEGRDLGARCWPPYRWELPDVVRGEREVTVRLAITTSAGPAIEGRAFDQKAGQYREL